MIQIPNPMEFADFHNYNQNDLSGMTTILEHFIKVSVLLWTPSYDEAYENNYLNRAIENHHDRATQPVHNRK